MGKLKCMTEEIIDFLERGYTVEDIAVITGIDKDCVQVVKDEVERGNLI